MKTFEVHVTNVYCVEGNTVEAARAKALAAWAGQTRDFEFGGMKIMTFKMNSKLKKNGNVQEKCGRFLPNKEEVIKKYETMLKFKSKKLPHNMHPDFMKELKAEERRLDGKTTKRTDRSAGKEREYIDFGQTDGI